jgi:YfiR/HmsC-like
MVKKNYILIIAIVLSLIGLNAYAGDIDKSKANKIKAGLLYNMAKMTTWPESSFINGEPISILFLGKDYNEIGSYFESQIRSRSLTVKGRKLTVKEIARTELDDVVREELKQCHMLFIMSSYKGSIMELLLAIGDRPVLVVGESSSFPKEGGMIGLSIEKKHVGISVNLDAVEKNDLSISAQLLQHAKIVKKEQ